MKDRKIEIEEVLRLKRYEKPTDGDWARFDEDLRSKMLLSMIRSEPRYKRFLRGVIGIKFVKGYGLAGAVAAFTIFTPFIVAYFSSSVGVASRIACSTNSIEIPVMQSNYASNVILAGGAEDFVTVRLDSDGAFSEKYVARELKSGMSMQF